VSESASASASEEEDEDEESEQKLEVSEDEGPSDEFVSAMERLLGWVGGVSEEGEEDDDDADSESLLGRTLRRVGEGGFGRFIGNWSLEYFEGWSC
jgi:hypothetical protein